MDNHNYLKNIIFLIIKINIITYKHKFKNITSEYE